MNTEKSSSPIILSITLAVSNLRAVFGIGNKDSEELSLTLDGFWALPHQRTVGWEGTLCGLGKINMSFISNSTLLDTSLQQQTYQLPGVHRKSLCHFIYIIS